MKHPLEFVVSINMMDAKGDASFAGRYWRWRGDVPSKVRR
jgi:hypothetical protein